MIGSSNPESVTGLEQDHVCSTCGAQYSTLKGLEVHEKVHGEPEELCHLCSERFYSKQQLKVCVLRGPTQVLRSIASSTSPHMWLADGDFLMCHIVRMSRLIAWIF